MQIVRSTALLSYVVAGLVILGVLFFVMDDRSTLNEILQYKILEKESFFDGFISSKRDTLMGALEDYTSWNDLVGYVGTPRRTWAQDNIDSILATYKTNGYWVFDSQGELVSSLLLGKDRQIHNQPFPGLLPPLNGQVILPRILHTETAAGIMEVFISSIHFAHDTKRSGSVQGYFLFARYLDDQYVKQLSIRNNWTVACVPHTPGRHESPAYRDGKLEISRTIKDINGKPLAVLTATTTLPAISYLEKHNRIHAGAGGVFILFFITTLVFFVKYQNSLKHAKNNLDEAQLLAKVGSWERDIRSGAGYWSENCFRLLGLEPGKAAPKLEELYGIIAAEDREKLKGAIQNAMATGRDYEIEFRRADDPEQRIFRVRGKSLRDETGTPTRLVGTFQDVTEKRQQERAREELLKQKEMFIVRLSHDIRTPLTPLVALLPTIQSMTADTKLQELLDICITNTNHMKELVIKTIKLARFSSPGRPVTVEMESLPLAELVHEYLAKRSDMLTGSSMHPDIDIDPAITVKAARIELEEVFYNLISNAVKYSPPKSGITIAARECDGTVTVRVTDTGIGLTPDELTHIFDEFYKADISRHELDSSGLGLSICKRIVENHGGRIWAESLGKGHGTTICFTIGSGGM